MSAILRIILISFVAGAVGTTLGGVLGILIKRPSKGYIACMLSFAAGAMLGMSIFEMMPEAAALGGVFVLMTGLTLGVVVMLLLRVLMDRGGGQEVIEHGASIDKRKLLAVGLAIFAAIVLHDLPEGMAIGAGEHIGIGLSLGVAMLLHNIPEGMAIAIPLKASNVSNAKILGLAFLAGVPTIFGAVLGYFVGINNIMIALMLAFAAGVMLYVILAQMLPAIYKQSNNYHMVMACIIAGVVMIAVFSSVLH